MYVQKNRRYRRKARGAGKRRNARRSGLATVPFVLRKFAALERTRETKCIQDYESGAPISSYGGGAYGGAANTLTVVPLNPNSLTLAIAQGSGQANRIGNKIETVKATLKLMFYPAAEGTDNQSPRPQVIKIWGLWYKKGDYSGAPPPAMPNFFQSGNTSIDPQGNLQDDFLTVNKDSYHVAFTRTFKVGNAVIYDGGATGGGALNQNQKYTNNDFKLNAKCTIDYTKHLFKTQTFNDSSFDPSNRQLYLVVESISCDNIDNGANNYPMKMAYEIDYRFKDA